MKFAHFTFQQHLVISGVVLISKSSGAVTRRKQVNGKKLIEYISGVCLQKYLWHDRSDVVSFNKLLILKYLV